VKTLLDNSGSWFLETLSVNDELRVVLIEGIRAREAESVPIGGHDFGPAYRVQPTNQSRRVAVTFSLPVAYQVMDESIWIPHDDEIHDNGTLRRYSRSRWMDYLRASSLFEHPTAEGAVHYQIVTENHVVDVASQDEPTVELLDRGQGV
jgi:hypothetical protein